MRAGRLDRRIYLLRNTPTQSSSGGLSASWAAFAAVSANVKYNRGSERFATQQIVGKGVCTFTIRWSTGVSDLNVKDLVSFDGREYDIHDVRELGRREGIEIDASARSETGLIWPRGYVNLGAAFLPVTAAGVQNVKNGIARFRSVCIWESTTRGTGAGTGANLNVDADQFSYPKYLSDYIASRGVRSIFASWIGGGFGPDGSDSRIETESGWNITGTVSLGGSMAHNSTTTNRYRFTSTEEFNEFVLWHLQFGGNGQFTVDLDDVVLGTFDADGANTIIPRSFGVSAGAHTINVRRISGGTVQLIGIEPYRSDAPAFEVSNAGIHGAQISTVAGSNNPVFSPLPALGTFGFDLAILMGGINDANLGTSRASFQGSIRELTDIQLDAGKEMLLASSTPALVAGGHETQQEYALYVEEVAREYSTTYVDLVELMGPYADAVARGEQADANHQKAAGNQRAANHIGFAIPGL